MIHARSSLRNPKTRHPIPTRTPALASDYCFADSSAESISKKEINK